MNNADIPDTDVHGRMQRTIQDTELDVTVIDGIGDGEGNSHRTLVSIRTNSPAAIESVKHDPKNGGLSFVIVGSWESAQFAHAMSKLFKEY